MSQHRGAKGGAPQSDFSRLGTDYHMRFPSLKPEDDLKRLVWQAERRKST